MKRRVRVALIVAAITGIAGSFTAPALGAVRGCKDGRVAFDSLRNGSRDIYVIPGPGTQGQPPAPDAAPLRLTTGADDEKPSWSPPDQNVNNFCDSPPIDPSYKPPPTMIAFQRSTSDGNTNIYAINAATPEPGGQATQLTHDAGADTAPAWAPVTPAGAPQLTYPPIAFVRSVNGHHDIFIVNANGTDETDLTNSSGADYGSPDWSPLGDLASGPPQTMSLALDSNLGGRREIWVMDITYDATNPPGHRYVNLGMREVTGGQPVSSNPSWFTFSTTNPTPIIDSLAFAGPDQDGGPSQIDTAQPTTIDNTLPPFSDPTSIDYSALTSDSTDNSAPAWAPKGDFIAFQKASAGGRSDIYVLDPTRNDETGDVNLTEGAGDNRNPDWEAVQLLSVDVFPIRPLGRRHHKRLAESDVSPQTPLPPTPPKPSQPGPPSPPPLPPAPAFAARVLSITAVGHGVSRTVLIRVRVNGTATVTAVLQTGHRRPPSHRRHVGAGNVLVRLRVPLGVRPGVYLVRVTVVPAHGPSETFAQRVHLGR